MHRGATDFLRHCSLLHGYCSYPLGTSALSLPLFLPLSVYLVLGHSLSFSPSRSPSCVSLSSVYLCQVLCQCPALVTPAFRLAEGCSAAEPRLLVSERAHRKLQVKLCSGISRSCLSIKCVVCESVKMVAAG